MLFRSGKELAKPVDLASMTSEQQRVVYDYYYQLGREYLKENPQNFGEIISRPVDRRENYVIPSSSLEKSLLTGDYLFVSKMSYGPRVPQTPLHMPLAQHTLPFFNCKSYLEHPQWDYKRVKGLGDVQLNDIVVFNFPAGDTVATGVPNDDVYTNMKQLKTK